jgi:hypothetical protein
MQLFLCLTCTTACAYCAIHLLADNLVVRKTSSGWLCVELACLYRPCAALIAARLMLLKNASIQSAFAAHSFPATLSHRSIFTSGATAPASMIWTWPVSISNDSTPAAATFPAVSPHRSILTSGVTAPASTIFKLMSMLNARL